MEQIKHMNEKYWIVEFGPFENYIRKAKNSDGTEWDTKQPEQ